MGVSDIFSYFYSAGMYLEFFICFALSFSFIYLISQGEQERVFNSISSSLVGVFTTSIFWIIDFNFYYSLISSVVLSILFYRRIH